jgi:hypothetical protein
VYLGDGCSGTYQYSGYFSSPSNSNYVRGITHYEEATSCYVVTATERNDGAASLVRSRVGLDNGCLGATPADPVTVLDSNVLPAEVGRITAVHVGHTSLMATNEGDPLTALFIGNDEGRFWMSEGTMFYFDTFDAWTELGPLPNGDPGPILAFATEERNPAESGSAVFPLFIATPAAVYRLP